jgi:cytochrome b6-f complex iron-sulfur subunit
MDRNEFIRLVGIGAGAVVLVNCLQGCKKESAAPALLTVGFTLDLSQPAYSALNTNGGYLITQKVIVARTLTGSYIAVAAACTHQGTNVQYQASSHRFHCPNHGADFSESGSVQSGPATHDLQQMHTSLTNTLLHVTS